MDTAEKMYKYFLSEVRKARNVTITPQQWSENIIFQATLFWVLSKLPMAEFIQKRIDDLEVLRVITDGIISPVLSPDANNHYTIPANYLYGLNMAFNISSSNAQSEEDPTGGGGTDTDTITYSIPATSVPGKILRSDSKVIVNQNPYRQVDESFVYFEMKSGLIVPTTVTGYYQRSGVMEYYRKPTAILFDGSNQVNGDFNSLQNLEITELAVSRYLGKTGDPRLEAKVALNSQIPK